ncbi:DNA alkylation repair protein [Pseudoalteromonas luteoviolacea]|uniref:DNA alkylation repair protein n=1 Tax=Pseudoalteromonas luteoviolacea TaxID=43657 RepID=UPI001B39543D|nr:DNA alkylation repair protein [Pseudoalteromonas luteoviolacea]MBQ4835518.1 DNA alkylation repair protein [Pseudoalteromonas luteoviolacea]
MPEPFKNVFDIELIRLMALHFRRAFPDFKSEDFISEIERDLDKLEFKQRSQRICEAMQMYLPEEFEAAAKIIERSLGDQIAGEWSLAACNENGISGWAIIPMSDYVAAKGKNHFELSMHLLKELTKRNTSEFAIRHFLITEPDRTLEVMKTWAVDSDVNVRRLASEGCRPRLPWGLQLKQYIVDPEPVIELLEILKDDPSEYVRRSVANNLNDIAKDHQERVSDIAAAWLCNASADRTALVKHACRTLIKKGHIKTLNVLGYGDVNLRSVTLNTSSPVLNFGDHIELTAQIVSDSRAAQSLIVDYIVHHQKANGTTSPKVFKWKSIQLHPGKSIQLKKKHAVKAITTRTYYPGIHKVELQINGKVVANTQFDLVM